MGKRGPATHGSCGHGREGSDKWKEDQTAIHHYSRENGIEYIALQKDRGKIFKSNTSSLRPLDCNEELENWGYMASSEIYSDLKKVSSKDFEESIQTHRKELTWYQDTSKRGEYDFVQKRKKKGSQSYLERFTMEVSPEISRGVDFALSVKGEIESMREKLEDLMPSIVSKFEETHKGAKVVGAGWHVLSGQLHIDLWAHDFFDKEVVVGKRKTKKTIRTRDHGALCHYGSGQGIVAWQRHLKVLGDDATSIAPATVLEVQRAVAGKEDRAEKLGRGSDSNRDIAMHSFLDEAVAELVPAACLMKGKKQYRAHLVKAYKAGHAGPNLDNEKKRERVENLAKAALSAVAEKLSTADKVIEPQSVLKELDVVIKKARAYDRIKGGVIKLLKWASKQKLPKGIKAIVDKLTKDPDVTPDR